MVIKKHERTRLDKFMRFLKFRILQANDAPKAVAMGVSLGLFIAWTPILGIRMIVAFFFAIIFKANRVVAMAVVWVCNPLTYIPMWSAGYIVGKITLKLFTDINSGQSVPAAQQASRFNLFELPSRFSESAFWKEAASSLLAKGLELWIGSLIIGAVFAIAGYFLTYYLIIKHRKKNPHRRFQEHL